MRAQHDILTDLLQQLGVPHTQTWSSAQFASLAFPSWFGLSRLLAAYGVDSEGVTLSDKSEVAKLTPPFVAAMRGGSVIVTSIDTEHGVISYLTEGVAETMPLADWTADWTGKALLAFPRKGSAEPDLAGHRLVELALRAKRVVLWALAALLSAWCFIDNRLWHPANLPVVLVLDCCGLLMSWMLLQKTVHVRSAAADRVCGVLQAGGCDSVLETKASSFFGIFSWSEVGFAYFSVSLLALLVFPAQTAVWLALVNVCCLPFTVWSISYQKWVLHTWCTLCVSVQTLLWLLFAAYLCGGWWHGLSQAPVMALLALIASYGVVLLATNRLTTFIKALSKK